VNVSIFVTLLTYVLGAQGPVYELEPIVVTASRVPQSLPYVARSVEVLGRDEIAHAPAHSVPDLLDYVPGVDVRRRGPWGVQADVSIRGGTFEQTLVLIDGVKVFDPQTGHHNMDLPLIPCDVERIEVLKGPGSRLYGPNAFGGAINIITRRDGHTALKAAAGQYGLCEGVIALSGSRGNLGLHFSLSGRRSAGYMDDTDFRIYTASVRSILRTVAGEMSLFGGYTDKEFGADGFYSQRFPNQWEHTRTVFLSLRASLVRYGLLWEPKIYWRCHRDEFVLDRDRPGWYRNRHTSASYGFELQSTAALPWGAFAFGGELGEETIASSNLGDHSRTRGGMFLELQAAHRRLSLTLGAYGYYYSDWGWRLWPGADIGFRFCEGGQMYGSLGRSFRVPTYTELYYSSPANRGNQNLMPEEAWTYEVGLRYGKPALGGGVALFRREGRNLIDWVREGSEDPWQAQNVAQMRTSGLEVDLRFAPVVGRLPQVEMGYAFLSSDKRTEGWESKYVLDYLMHQFSVGVAHPLISGWRGDWKLRYERRVGGEGHFILDLKVSGRPKGLEVFLECTNILNTSYTETGGVPMPGRWITGGLGFVF